ncbi:MAG: phage major capsid protein [Finegoldia sp.]|nr:phage major capsid protein [Finegoldia sp.]
MPSPLGRGELFSNVVVDDLINKVKGKSSVAKLSGQSPIAFNGNEIFIFSFDKEVNIVGENQKKAVGGVNITSKKMIPLKLEYSARFSDEFMYSTNEYRFNIMKEFNDGYSRKLARAIDLMVFHGVNPRDNTASTIIGDNCLDKQVKQVVTYDAATFDDNIDDAMAMIQANQETVSGIALAPVASQAMSKIKVNGIRQYPEFRLGAYPNALGGAILDVNETVSDNSNVKAYIGDFRNNFKWGFAKQIPLEVIEYGDPDNTGQDLKGYNQVLLRAETYIGWGIIDENSFAIIKDGEGA